MAARKNTSRKRNKKQTKKKQDSQSFLKDEIIILSALAAGILLLISNFGIGGFVGDAVSSVLFGLFGTIAYIIPILLFTGIAFVISNKGNSIAYIKTVAGVGFTWMVCTLFQLIMNEYTAGTGLFSYYKISSMHKDGGGLFGGIVVSVLCPAIGVIGTYVVAVILCIICLVIITEKSFIRSVKKGSEKAYSSAKQDAKKRKEQAELRREKRAQEREQKAAEKERKRKDNTVSGVSFDTTLVKKSPEMREITPPEEVPDLFAEEIPSYDGREAEVSKNTIPDDITINRAQPIMEEEVPIPEPVPEKRKTKESKKQVETATANVEQEIKKSEEKQPKEYVFPPLSLLKHGKKSGGDSDTHLRQTAMKLQQTLQNFNVNVTVTNVSCGPSVTRYELQPEQGVKVSKIVGLADDIKLNLAAADIRIEAPIPGKAAVGIEVPNKENTAVMLRDLLETDEFQKHESKIAFAAGRDIAGKVVVADIMKMPHVLIAGATGSGKSVCINTLIMSILYKADPKDVKLIMIDPKVVELSVYNGIPHLLIPVVTDPKKAAGALNWAVAEMMKRYQLFAQQNVRDLKGYNEKIAQMTEEGAPKKLPKIVIIVDELADLMMVAPGEVEGAICRLAQLARAAGLHLIIATQRPSVNVITGLIKANMPSRIAFSVSSGVDSRTIIDMNGAEKLLGKGDMLFYPTGYPKPVRVQGSFVSDKEVQKVVDYLIEHNGNASYSEEVEEHVNSDLPSPVPGIQGAGVQDNANEQDAYFADAGRLIIEKEKASIGMLQRMFKIGFNRAARIMDQLASAGVVGEEVGTKPRKVLMTKEEFEQYIQENL